MIPREVIDEIRYRCDVEEVIGSYVSLKRAGSNRQGLCPFHSEKSPSFTVFPNTKSFYCFGCGAGGDVITFIQKIENLDYVSAVEFLGARAGIDIPNDTSADKKESISRKRIYEMNKQAAIFFRNCLLDPVLGREGMTYLTQNRRLSGAVIRRFGLGFAPNEFGLLTRHMRSLGYSDDELVAAFLSRRGESAKGKWVGDMFRNRVMFPVIDTAGNIVAFGGRVMDDSKPKYLNSSDTPGFKKSRVLFGMNYAKDNAAEQMILCEGYMDTIAMHAAGFGNAVATLGTAITSEHARLLARYTKRVVINYDSDEAGQKAAYKAMSLLDEVGVEVRVLKLTGAKDADEFIRTHGADAFREMIGQSRAAFDFKMESVLARHDLSTTQGKIRAANELCGVIAEVLSGVEREIYIKKAAATLGISESGLAEDVRRIRAKRRREREQKAHRDVVLSARNFGDRINPDAAKDPAAAAAEDAILGMLLLYPEHRAAVVAGKVALEAEDFFTELGKRAFSAITDMEKSDSGFVFSALGEQFNPDEMGRLVRLMRDREELHNDSGILSSAAQALRDMRGRREARQQGDWQSEIERRRAARKKKQED